MRIRLCDKCIETLNQGCADMCDECVSTLLKDAALDDTRRFLRQYPGEGVTFRNIPYDQFGEQELRGLARYLAAQVVKYRDSAINGEPLTD